MTKEETLAMEKSDEDFQKDLQVNKYKLDEECISHASRYAYYAEACTVAKSNVSEAKDNLEYITAEANIRIRKNLTDSGQKFTEAVISSMLTLDSDVEKAKSELRNAEAVFGRLQVAVNAMDARRSELDNLVKLYVAGYYSVADGAGVKKSITENVASDIRRNLNNR